MTGLLTGPRPSKKKGPAVGQGSFLEPRQETWGWMVAGLVIAAPVVGALLFIVDQPGPGIGIPIALVLAAAAHTVFSIRDSRRRRLVDKLVEALSPTLGSRADRAVVRADKWEGFWHGTPGRLRLRYAAGIDDTDPRWLGEIRSHVERRVGFKFDITVHNRKKCLIELRPSPEVVESNATSEVGVRATRVVAELLGSATQPTPDVEMQWRGEELVALEVGHSLGSRIARVVYRQQVERTLSTMLPGRWRAKWDLEKDHVRFEQRPDLPASIPHPPVRVSDVDAKNTYGEAEIAFGVDEDGHTMKWVPKRNPHLLITGTSGSGKTVTMQGILAEVTNLGWRVGINDAKLIEFLGFRDWPNVEVVASNLEEQVRLIHAAWELQEERYELIVNGEASEDDFEPYCLFLDEFADFREAITDWYMDVKQKGDPAKPPVLKKVRSIARKGRTARVHLVVGLQRPDAEFLTGEVRDNFSARASMGRLSPQGAQMMWENASTGVSLPRKSQGRGMTLSEDSMPVEFQSFWTPDPRKIRADDPENMALIESLRPTSVRHPRKMIVTPEPMTDLDGKGEDVEPSYTEYASAKIVPYTAEAAARQRPKLTVVTGGGESAPVRAVAKRLELVEPDFDDTEDGDGYGEATTGSTADLRPGDLVLLDDTVDLWGVVEASEPDIVETENVCVDYRTDDGEMGSISLPDDETVSIRKPIESKEN